MHSYEAWAGLLKFIDDLCLYQVTLNHLIPRGHVELITLPTVYLTKRQVHPKLCFSVFTYTKLFKKSAFVPSLISTAFKRISSVVCLKPEAALKELSC